MTMMCRTASSSEGFLASSFPLESLDVEAAPSDDDYGTVEYTLQHSDGLLSTLKTAVATNEKCMAVNMLGEVESEGFLASSFPLEDLDLVEAAPSDYDDDDDYGLFIEEMEPAEYDRTASQIAAPASQFLDTRQQEIPLSDHEYGLFIEELMPIKEQDDTYSVASSGDNDFGQFTEMPMPLKQEPETPQGAALTAEGLSSLQPRQSKSSMKKISSYGALEALGDNIPISVKRNAFKMLPAPSMKKSGSLASFFNETPKPIIKKRVCFHNIHVRDYDQTIGDHPSCSYGTPVSLDWNYQENEALNIDLYEGNRLTRRSMRDMHLNYYQRKHLLSLRHSEEEIAAGKKAAEKLKFQRSVTQLLKPMMKLEDIVESAGRKAKRFLKKNKKSSMAKKCLSMGNLVLEDTSTVSRGSILSRKTV